MLPISVYTLWLTRTEGGTPVPWPGRAVDGFADPSSGVITPGSRGQEQGVPLRFAFLRGTQKPLELKAQEKAGAGQAEAERRQVALDTFGKGNTWAGNRSTGCLGLDFYGPQFPHLQSKGHI